MCVVSMVIDQYSQWWWQRQQQPQIVPGAYPTVIPSKPQLTDEEVKQFREMVARAKQYDIDNDEPNCEMDEKKQRIRKYAKELGVELGEI